MAQKASKKSFGLGKVVASSILGAGMFATATGFPTYGYPLMFAGGGSLAILSRKGGKRRR